VLFARQEAPDPARSALRSLRPSLNTPVVVMEDLPSGPASAVIACLGGPAGSRVALAIRSERSGQVVFFGPDEELREWQGRDLALDAALSFAESMGFLFEDDRVREAPGEARRLWEALLEASGRARVQLAGEGDPAPGAEASPRAASARPAAQTDPDDEELWLEEVAVAGPVVSASISLSKFRRAPGAPPARAGEAVPGARQPLARFRVGLPRGRS
jgi:hypothetical protein